MIEVDIDNLNIENCRSLKWLIISNASVMRLPPHIAQHNSDQVRQSVMDLVFTDTAEVNKTTLVNLKSLGFDVTLTDSSLSISFEDYNEVFPLV